MCLFSFFGLTNWISSIISNVSDKVLGLLSCYVNKDYGKLSNSMLSLNKAFFDDHLIHIENNEILALGQHQGWPFNKDYFNNI